MHDFSHRKFTILIPTRDRADTLIYTLATAVSQSYSNLEIIVSDNASSDHTEKVVKSFADSRVHYLNTGKRLSMSHNWEFALNHVTDGWVTILGDDDAILPGALEKVNDLINATQTQVVRSYGINYLWPSALGEPYGRLRASLGRGYKCVNSSEALRQVMTGKLSYVFLPVLYNGTFVDFKLIEKAKSISGTFFQSLTPDVYSGMVFSMLTDQYIYSNESFAINGASHHSGGTAAFGKINTTASYDPARKFWSEENIPFHPDLPLIEGRPVRSTQVVVYEAYLQASCFHKYKPDLHSLISRKQQLEIVLRNDLKSSNQEEILQWANLFSHKFNLGTVFTSNRLISESNSYTLLIRSLLTRLASLPFYVSVHGHLRMPLNNVYEASVLTVSFRNRLFSYFYNLSSFLRVLLKSH
jgi:glycosyltransferase involved in cell wall biosynthesis